MLAKISYLRNKYLDVTLGDHRRDLYINLLKVGTSTKLHYSCNMPD